MSGSPGGIEQDLGARPIISPSVLLPAEIIIIQAKPSLWYVVFVSLPIVAAGVALTILAFAIDELPNAYQHWGIMLGGSVVGLRIVFGLLQWLGRTYVLTDRRILTQTGVFSVRVECLGLEEIENTFVAEAAVQRVLNIGNIFFRCASHQALAWEHIARPKEVHAKIVLQIDRWKRSLKPPPAV